MDAVGVDEGVAEVINPEISGRVVGGLDAVVL
jgi:hypothetical protein